MTALWAVMDFAVEVDEAVNSKLLAHFEAGRAFSTLEFFGVLLEVLVDEFDVTVAGCCVGEEAGAD